MAREMAVQMLYQVDLGEATPHEAIAAFDLIDYLQGDEEAESGEGESSAPAKPAPLAAGRLEEGRRAFEQAGQMLIGTRQQLEQIDERLKERAENWRLERMPPVDRNILRLAVWEMLFDTEVPTLVVVDEAVELAKHFGSDQSSRFVNGLLDGILRSLVDSRKAQ